MNRPNLVRRASTIAVLAAMALVVLDAGLATLALPEIARSLGVTPAASILVASSYQLAVLTGLLPAAQLADRLGPRRLFMAGTVIFSLASASAAFAPSLAALAIARFVQGLGGSAILALGISLLRSILGTERLGSAIAWNAMNVALCAAAGPAIGAIILTYAGWRWLFLASLPLGLLVIIASFALPHVEQRRLSVDLPGILLHAGGVCCLFAALHIGAVRPVAALGLAMASGACFAVLLRRERHRESQLVPMDLLGDRKFRRAVLASICCFTAQSAGLLALPFYVELELSGTSLAAGLVLACWPIAVAISSSFTNRLAQFYGPRLLCGAGASIMAAGLFSAALLPTGSGMAPLAICAMICGAGFSLFQIPNNHSLFLAARAERSAAAGGMQGTARLVGQVTGSLLIAQLFASPHDVAPARLAMAVAALAALVAAIVSSRQSASNSGPASGALIGNTNG